MSTYVIETDGQGKFDSQYPLHLQGLVTPQEYHYLIEQANYFMAKRTKSVVVFVLLMFCYVFIFFGAAAGGMAGIAATQKFYLMAIIPIASMFILMALWIITIFAMQRRSAKILANLKNFIEMQNQQIFLPRGVQFLVKSRVYGYGKRRMEHVYLEVLVSPNAIRSGSGIQSTQPVIQQQQIYQPPPNIYQPNVVLNKTYPQPTSQFQYNK